MKKCIFKNIVQLSTQELCNINKWQVQVSKIDCYLSFSDVWKGNTTSPEAKQAVRHKSPTTDQIPLLVMLQHTC